MSILSYWLSSHPSIHSSIYSSIHPYINLSLDFHISFLDKKRYFWRKIIEIDKKEFLENYWKLSFQLAKSKRWDAMTASYFLGHSGGWYWGWAEKVLAVMRNREYFKTICQMWHPQFVTGVRWCVRRHRQLGSSFLPLFYFPCLPELESDQDWLA